VLEIYVKVSYQFHRERSDTFHRVASTVGVPAYMNALVRPIRTSPFGSSPLIPLKSAVSHAERVTRSASILMSKISSTVSRPSSPSPGVNSRFDMRGNFSIISPWVEN